jgi:hypothetical protein
MCNVNMRRTRVKKAFRIYKQVDGYGGSRYLPHTRSAIRGFPAKNRQRGTHLEYVPGTTVVSPSGPGIMAYTTLPEPTFSRDWMVLRVPKGAYIRRGDDDGDPIIAASKVFVVGPL